MNTLKIGDIEIGEFPKIVSVVWGCEVEKWASESKKYGADLLEVRIDLYKDQSPDKIKESLRNLSEKARNLLTQRA